MMTSGTVDFFFFFFYAEVRESFRFSWNVHEVNTSRSVVINYSGQSFRLQLLEDSTGPADSLKIRV